MPQMLYVDPHRRQQAMQSQFLNILSSLALQKVAQNFRLKEMEAQQTFQEKMFKKQTEVAGWKPKTKEEAIEYQQMSRVAKLPAAVVQEWLTYKSQYPDATMKDFYKARKTPGVTVNIGAASASERTDIADARASMDALNNLNNLFDATFVGPVKGRVGKVKDAIGANPQMQSEFYASTAAFKNAIIKQITGAQMSEAEASRIMKQVPDVDDPPSVWRAKWRQSMKNIKYMEKRRLEILRQSGLKVPGEATTYDPDDPLGLFK